MKSNTSNRCTTNYLPHDSQLFEFHLEQYHIIYKLRRRQELGYCLFGVEYVGSSEKMICSIKTELTLLNNLLEYNFWLTKILHIIIAQMLIGFSDDSLKLYLKVV